MHHEIQTIDSIKYHVYWEDAFGIKQDIFQDLVLNDPLKISVKTLKTKPVIGTASSEHLKQISTLQSCVKQKTLHRDPHFCSVILGKVFLHHKLHHIPN